MVVIRSDQSLDHFPGNTAVDFTNHLANPIRNADQYEVGLVKMIYQETRQDTTSGQKFFTNENDRTIQLVSIESFAYILSKPVEPATVTSPEQPLIEFMSEINETLTKDNQPITFEADLVEKRIILEITDVDSILTIPEKLANAFGFDQFQFRHGEHTGVRDLDPTLYHQIPNGEDIQLNISKETRQTIQVTEPKQFKFPQLVDAIQQVLKPKGVEFGWSPGTLTVNIPKRNIQFQLSEKLSNWLQIDPGQWLTSQSYSARLSEHLTSQAGSLLFLLIDGVQPQRTGSNLWPQVYNWLKTSYNRYSLTPFLPVFVPVQYTYFDKIRVRVVDEFGQIPEFVGPTIVTLYFQLREQY